MALKGKKAVVTGGAGFIGSHLVDRLLQSGMEVTVIDMMSERNKGRLSHAKGKIKIINSNISDSGTFKGLEADFIFHLAAYAVPNACDKNPDIAFKANVLGTYNVLKFGMENSVAKVVFPSSALLYGKNPKYLPIDEKHPIETSSVYNITKKLGEDLCKYFIESSKLPIVYLRLFNSFGPRQDSDYFIPTVITQALKSKEIEIWSEKPTRDFTFVHDTVDAFVKAAESDFVGGPINIGSGKEVEVGKIASLISKRLGAKLKILNKPVSGSMRLACDNSLAKKLIGWQPKTDFEQGLNETMDWFKKNES